VKINVYYWPWSEAKALVAFTLRSWVRIPMKLWFLSLYLCVVLSYVFVFVFVVYFTTPFQYLRLHSIE
jgi:hypothetical protein